MTIRYSSRLWLLFSSCLVLASCSSPNSEAPGGSGAAPSSGGAGAGGTSSTGATSGGGSGGRITGGTLEAGAGGVGAGAGAGGSGAGSGGAAAGSGGTGSGGTECPPFAIPSAAELVANPKLPDPFTFMDGSKVETKADWVCRRQEISQLAQAFIYGRKPPDPESVEATYSGGTLDITVTDGGKSLEFSVEITGAGSGDGSPAVIDFGGGLAVSGAKTIAFGSVSMELAASSFSQGRDAPSGKFYELYPDYQDTGSLMAWAWGASRIIDALEKTTGHGIDPTKITSTGCSRNGKAAATVGLFDERIALVTANSPGSGTTSGWRVAEVDPGDVQTAGQIYGEDTWMGENFGDFGESDVEKLPIDQHEVLALAYPRPLIILEGTNDGWNCPTCVYTTMKYTQIIYEALGAADYIGFSHPNHGHCQQSSAQQSVNWFNAFVDRFLKGETTSTADMFDDSFSFDADRWQDGPAPSLL